MRPLFESLSRRKIDRSTSLHTSQVKPLSESQSLSMSLSLPDLWFFSNISDLSVSDLSPLFCHLTVSYSLVLHLHRSTNSLIAPIDLTSQRKVMDEKIRLKEEQEEFKVLKEEMDVKVGPPKRDEWMTTLPPERKPGVPTQTTKFSRTSKDGRGDTSIWTDNPSERAQKAKMNYLEAYNEAAALASTDQENKITNSDAALVDEYNKRKRPKSLLEKHREAARTSRSSKKKSKQERAKEEWEGQHPWKPWDREKDLTAGRQSVKLYAEDMSQGLASRFSSGTFQRNFL